MVNGKRRINSRELAAELKYLAEEVKAKGELGRKMVRTISKAREGVKGIKGLDSDSTKSEKLRTVGVAFLMFPGDPTGITYAIGGAIYTTGSVVRAIERKNMGLKDIIRMYRRLGIELEYLFRED